MQQEILAKNRSSEISVYVVWLSMLSGDTQDRLSEAEERLDDPRVTHFWDEERSLGRWVKENVLTSFTERDWVSGEAPGAGLSVQEIEQIKGGQPLQEDIVWDAYLLYGGEARWDETPEPLVGWGSTVIQAADKLLEEVTLLLAE